MHKNFARAARAHAASLALLAALGCAVSDEASSALNLRQQAAALFPRIDPSAGGGASADCAGAWAVLLQVYSAEQAELAQAALAFARDRARLADARLEERTLGVALVAGRFSSRTDPQASSALERIRGLQIDSRQPFASAILLPPASSASLGGAPQWSLATLRAQRSGDDALYTLQVAVYESANPSLACQAAEQATAALRADGEDAYYHHGAGRSIVTIGVFTPADYNPLTGVASQRLEQTRQRFPYNLVNGRTIRQRMPDDAWSEQPSALVVVP